MANWIRIPFPWGKTRESKEESVNVEEYVDNLKVNKDGFVEEEGVIYVKPVDLSTETAVEDTVKEFRGGNIVIIDIHKTLGDSAEMYRKIREIKKYCHANGGEVCRVSEVKLMVLPEGMEVVYPSSSQEPEE